MNSLFFGLVDVELWCVYGLGLGAVGALVWQLGLAWWRVGELRAEVTELEGLNDVLEKGHVEWWAECERLRDECERLKAELAEAVEGRRRDVAELNERLEQRTQDYLAASARDVAELQRLRVRVANGVDGEVRR